MSCRLGAFSRGTAGCHAGLMAGRRLRDRFTSAFVWPAVLLALDVVAKTVSWLWRWKNVDAADHPRDRLRAPHGAVRLPAVVGAAYRARAMAYTQGASR